MSGRDLTSGEITLAEDFYETLLDVIIDYSTVEIHDHEIGEHQDDSTIMTIPDMVNPFDDDVGIYYPKQPGDVNHDYYSTDFSLEADTELGWRRKHNFIHELWHVKAANEMTDLEYAVIVGSDAREGNYNYEEVFNGTNFEDLNHEQQAEFLGDYYLMIKGKGNYIELDKPGGTVASYSLQDYQDVLNGVDLENLFNDNKEPTTEQHLDAIEPEGGDSTAQDADSYADDVKDLVDTADDRGSPLIMDIDGNGYELTNLASVNAVYWDIDSAKNDGMAEATGWVTGGDGLLAIDLNDDGIINNSGELFGNQTGYDNGFLALKAYDANGDNVINAEDAVFVDLLVWIDSTLDGYSEDTELHTMSDLGITSINLAYSNVSDTVEGNQILQESTFVIGGNTRDIGDVYFSYSDLNTVYDTAYSFDDRAFFLPTLRGYGNLPHLHAAISLDNDDQDADSLISLVTDFAALDLDDIFDETSGLIEDVKDIMFRWAGVDGLTGDERGSFIDSRELGFLEKMMGQDFLQQGIWSNPGPVPSEDLKEAFNIALNNIYARLVAQAAGGELFTGDFYYDISTDSFSGITGLDSGALDDLETEATGLSNTGQRQVFWENVVRMVEFAYGTSNLSGGDLTALQDAITNSDATLDLEDDILPALEYTVPAGGTYNGTSGPDTTNGSSGDDVITGLADDDTLSGLGGNDDIDGGADDDILDGGTGGDYLKGGTGDDHYLYDPGDGDDRIKETNTGAGNDNDRIIFGAGIDSGDVTITRVGNTDLLIAIDTGVYTGQIIIENQFNYSAGGGHVEWIEFDDTSTIDLDAPDYTLNGTAGNDTLNGVTAGADDDDTINGLGGNDIINGGNGDDILNGGDGNDTINGDADNDTITGGNGNDVIDGGAGNDTIDDGAGDDIVSGGTGDDTFIYVSGNDVYEEDSGTDTIDLDPAWTAAGTQYFKIGNDLQIYFDADNSITIPGFYASGGAKIETLDFDSDTDVNLTTVSTVTQGTSGNDSISGTSNGDTIYGFGGNDTLNGGSGSAGNDFLYGGTGDDTLNGGNDNDYLDGGAGDDTMNGGNGNDHYFYVSGDDIVDELAGTDILELASGWEYGDLTFRRYLTDTADLIIEINGSNSITVKDQFIGQPVETLRMNDGSGDIAFTSIQVETHGNSSNNTISAITSGMSTDNIIYGLDGNDTLNGNTGNDALYGGNGTDTLNASSGNDVLDGGAGNDNLNGGAGNDTYYFYAGGGLDTAAEGGLGGTDEIRITGGTTINDITVADISTYNTKITVTASVDELTITNQRHSSGHYIETISFDDGFTTELTTYNSWLKGTSGNDVVAGSSSDETLIGYAGNDDMDGGGGSDDIHGGDGDDDIHGDGGADLIYGGAGDDILYGDDGLDTLVGGAGADTFVFEAASAFNDVDVVKDFSTGQGDIIDIADVLDGYYTFGVDDITDFVQITDNGTDTTLKIDQDGGADAFVTVATLLGITGLTDETALETAGILVTA